MKNSKTVEEWYQYLPLKLRTKAIEYAKSCNTLTDRVYSLKSALAHFVWYQTEEGNIFWSDLALEVAIQESQPNFTFNYIWNENN